MGSAHSLLYLSEIFLAILVRKIPNSQGKQERFRRFLTILNPGHEAERHNFGPTHEHVSGRWVRPCIGEADFLVFFVLLSRPTPSPHQNAHGLPRATIYRDYRLLGRRLFAEEVSQQAVLFLLK